MVECSIQEGRVVQIRNLKSKQETIIKLDSETIKALNYPNLTGFCQIGDVVAINSTAEQLGLGTGGWHYVVAIRGRGRDLEQMGHIMKLRYTPLQGRILAVEEEISPFHEVMAKAQGLAGMVVAVGSLHSMLAPLAWVIGNNSKFRLAYLMSDGGALPFAFSQIVPQLLERNLIHKTITFGHAFGGELEAVNIYSALLAAKHVVQADLAVVLMGPGVVGTNTTWGTTALEQGVYLNAVLHLNGIPVVIPRLSESDERSRHFGLSHHTKTCLTRLVKESVHLPLPIHLRMFPNAIKEILQMHHKISWINTELVFENLLQADLPFSTMGRTPVQDPLFFHGVVATALFILNLLYKGD